jgi:DNA repair protein RadC
MTPSPFSPQRKLGISIKEMPAEYRPQTRLISDGSTALSYAELLSIIIRTGSQIENVINLCQRILSQFDVSPQAQWRYASPA